MSLCHQKQEKEPDILHCGRMEIENDIHASQTVCRGVLYVRK